MYKFSPGLGTPLKYNPCDTKVSTASTCNVASSPTKVKSNSALVANEKPVSATACVTVVFNVSEVSLAIASINPKVDSPTNNAWPTVSCEVKAVPVPVTVVVLPAMAIVPVPVEVAAPPVVTPIIGLAV